MAGSKKEMTAAIEIPGGIIETEETPDLGAGATIDNTGETATLTREGSTTESEIRDLTETGGN